MIESARSGIDVLEGDESGIFILREMGQKVSIFVCLLPLRAILCAKSQSRLGLGHCFGGRHGYGRPKAAPRDFKEEGKGTGFRAL